MGYEGSFSTFLEVWEDFYNKTSGGGTMRASSSLLLLSTGASLVAQMGKNPCANAGDVPFNPRVGETP